ncbi:MAG: SDR family oxidoreductase [Porticoccaceae bacterium]|nr:SDR family oxidoreductase [Porticoccaceae bacterium]
MSGILDGRIAVITGAGSGIGRGSALCFAEAGATVVVSDIDVAGGEGTVELIKQSGGAASFIKCDVSKAAEVEALIAGVVAEHGRVDCAYNNAGVEGESAPVHLCSEDNFDFNYKVNLKGVFLCMKYEIQQMLKQENGGSIVSTASIAGLVGGKYMGAYVAAKHGVVGLTKSAALEYATKKIRVNAVCPGAIRTPMLERLMEEKPKMAAATIAMEPIGRLGEPEEIGRAAAWLCSDQASFVTGHAMPVDGGIVAA